MTIQREWIIPIATGAFLLSAVTGIALFFHVETGLSKFLHEWLSWLFVGAVLLHIATNLTLFKEHLARRKGQVIVGVFALALVASFVLSGPGGGRRHGPPFRSADALAEAPLATLAQVAKISPDELRTRLAKANVKAPVSDTQTLSDLVGPDSERQTRVLAVLFSDKD